MRIRELLEGNLFNELAFLKPTNDGRELDFDLTDDLMFFMHDDDDVYRRHLHPAITKCVIRVNKKRNTHPKIFEPAVQSAYKSYINQFPIRELPDTISEKMCNEICTKLHDEACEHIAAGKYKD